MVIGNLLFGTGTGDHMDTLKPLIPKKDAFLNNLPHPHNSYIEVLWQFGVIGLFIFLNIFYQISRYKTSTLYQKEVLILVTVAIGIAIMTEPFGPDKFYLPLWVTLVSVSITKQEYPSFQVDKFNRNTVFMYVGLISALLVLAFFQ
jgi:O-antigen ligase